MVLTDRQIKYFMNQGSIVIEPFNPEDNLGTNSCDVHLGEHMAVYGKFSKDAIKLLVTKNPDDNTIARISETFSTKRIDAKKKPVVTYFKIPKTGITICPGVLYLGVTAEYTETHLHVPFLEGKSSVGRLGIDIHATAGKGDVGFCNHWTLEISGKQPATIYHGMPVAQLIYFQVDGKVDTKYTRKKSAKYVEKSDMPQPSGMWKNYDPKTKQWK